MVYLSDRSDFRTGRNNCAAQPHQNVLTSFSPVAVLPCFAIHLFPTWFLRWDPSDPLKTFTFGDGGMTLYNNLTFLPFRMAKLDAVDQIENLIQIGLKAGDKTKLEHVTSFALNAVATS